MQPLQEFNLQLSEEEGPSEKTFCIDVENPSGQQELLGRLRDSCRIENRLDPIFFPHALEYIRWK